MTDIIDPFDTFDTSSISSTFRYIFLGIKYFRNCSITYESLKHMKVVEEETGEGGGNEGRSSQQGGKILLAVHPHGIFCMGWAILFGSSKLDAFDFCFSTALYNSPFFRVRYLFLLLLGQTQ